MIIYPLIYAALAALVLWIVLVALILCKTSSNRERTFQKAWKAKMKRSNEQQSPTRKD